MPCPIPPSVLAIAMALCLSPAVYAQLPSRLLFDVEPTPKPISSNPDELVVLNGAAIFVASDLIHGRELWKQTASGPMLLKDIFPGSVGSKPTGLILFQGRVWFAATDDQNGRELWASDGTSAGTVLIANLEPGAESSTPEDFLVCGNKLFFSAFEINAGREPHCSDGTAAGTGMIKDVFPGSPSSKKDDYRFTCCNDLLFFFATDGVTGREPWRSDGTLAGTFLLGDLRPGTRDSFDNFDPPVCCNDKLYFRAFDAAIGEELFVSDGTVQGTRLVIEIRPGGLGGEPDHLFCLNNRVLFQARTTAEGRELWSSDGTAIGTALVKDIRAGSSDGSPQNFFLLGSRALFVADDGIAGSELFITDGTAAGTQRITDLSTGLGNSFPSDFALLGNQVVFHAIGAGVGGEPFLTDGTSAGTRLLADLNPGLASSSPREFTLLGNRLVFSASIAALGREVFATDGTTPGTVLLQDLAPGASNSDPTAFVAVGGELFFRANGVGGAELYATDGTPSGTGALAEIETAVGTGDSNPEQFTPVGPNRFFFVATTLAHGAELFFFDGVQAIALELAPGALGSQPSDLTLVGDTLYFTATTLATGRELFRVKPGQLPQIVEDLRPGTSGSSPSNLHAIGHQHLACRVQTQSQGAEVATVENGVAGMTVHDLNPGFASSSPGPFARLRDANTGKEFAVFAARDGVAGVELFMTDGLSVALALDIETGATGSNPDRLRSNDDASAVLFSAEQQGETKLFRVIADENLDFGVSIEEVISFVTSFRLEAVKEGPGPNGTTTTYAVLTETSTPFFGTELYRIENGFITLLQDLNPGIFGSDPDDFVIRGTKIFFTAFTAAQGRELFCLDAANNFGVLSFDLNPGFPSSNPTDLTLVGDTLFFTATTPQGRVLLRTDGNAIVVSATGSPVAVVNENGKVITRANPGTPEDSGTLAGAEPYVIDLLNASSTSLGFACDGRATTTATTPTLGQNTTWTASFGPFQSVGIMMLDVLFAAPVDVLGCQLWVGSPAAAIMASGVAPNITATLPVPNIPVFAGLRLSLQTLWLNPSAVPQFIASNAVVLTLGV